jgi:hypothetical protein
MSALPTQLPWGRFVCFLRDLGYHPLRAHRGTLRQFFSFNRSPNLISFHEPHSGDSLHKAALYDSLQKLKLSEDEFVQLPRRH